jgi:hypothetical protein
MDDAPGIENQSDTSEINRVLAILTVNEKKVLSNIPIISKTKTNVFHWKQLRSKRDCWDLDIENILRGLTVSTKLLIVDKGKGKFAPTHLGQKIYHRLHIEKVKKMYPGIKYPSQKR